jgi:cellulose biosynthesis protein BcsQ
MECCILPPAVHQNAAKGSELISLAFFNNKGGVGKTTLSCNMAYYLAHAMHQNVLVIDCDPQCNATQLLLPDDVWEDLYSNRRESSNRTLLKALRHIRAGDSTIDFDLRIERSERFACDVLAGHPNLSILEDTLSLSWGEFRQGTAGGARRSLWAYWLSRQLNYDVIIFDLGPSLGALNRSVLLGGTHFVTPMSADLFSLYALDNIGSWIRTWSRDYLRAVEGLQDTGIDADLAEYAPPTRLPILSGYIGYTVQQYVSKTARGTVRAVQAYDRYKKQIPERAMNLVPFQADTAADFDLGVVPNMFSMIPLAQSKHAPVADLTQADGLRGGQPNQQAKYVQRLTEIGERLAYNLGLGD